MPNNIQQQPTQTESPAHIPQDIDHLIQMIQLAFPGAGIRVTGRARTIRRQAELMAQRIRANREEFLATYRPRPHIIAMDNWLTQHGGVAGSTEAQTSDAFELIIRFARTQGAVVSNHLSDTARDISWPQGTDSVLNSIEARINQLGASVIREPNAAGGRHWHIDW